MMFDRNGESLDFEVVTKPQLRELIKDCEAMANQLGNMIPKLHLLLGEGSLVRHLTAQETEVYRYIEAKRGVTVCDVVTASDLCDSIVDDHPDDPALNSMTASRIGQMMKKFGCFTKRTMNNTITTKTVHILRNVDDYDGMTPVELYVAYREAIDSHLVSELVMSDDDPLDELLNKDSESLPNMEF